MHIAIIKIKKEVENEIEQNIETVEKIKHEFPKLTKEQTLSVLKSYQITEQRIRTIAMISKFKSENNLKKNWNTNLNSYLYNFIKGDMMKFEFGKEVKELPASTRESTETYNQILDAFLKRAEKILPVTVEKRNPSTVATALRKIVADRKLKMTVSKVGKVVYLSK